MVNILASLNCTDEVHLIIGISGSTYSRVQAILANDAKPIIITNDEDTVIPRNLSNLAKTSDMTILNRKFDLERDLLTLGRSIVGNIVDRVFVNLSFKHLDLSTKIYEKCKVYRIPINTTESSNLSTFTVLSTYTEGDFQMGITTSGKGCKLANRIKRELISHLPKDLDKICQTVGELRQRIQLEDNLKLAELYKSDYESILQNQLGEHEEDSIQNSKLNNFVSEFSMTEAEKKLQRSRWLSQVVEYYPFSALASISINDLSNAYHNHDHQSATSNAETTSTTTTSQQVPSVHTNTTTSLVQEPELKKAKTFSDDDEITEPTTTNVSESKQIPSISNKGSISLVGSGPGSLSLLTLGALQEIKTADLVLADKLVPQQVIDLIPTTTSKFIARKFPGNAEAAQNELLELGLKALKEGKKVVRLKQGDPYIFGRGGEEYLYFEENGFKPSVLPGITSALSATVNSQIPATQRDVSDQVLICTGTGRRGVLPSLPEFVEKRTTIFLMALHRISDLVPALIEKGWDPEVPATIVERSSCPDQRVTRTRLKDLIDAVEEIGSRPPGLLVVGYACEVLNKPLGQDRWIVEEGFQSGNDEVQGLLESIHL